LTQHYPDDVVWGHAGATKKWRSRHFRADPERFGLSPGYGREGLFALTARAKWVLSGGFHR